MENDVKRGNSINIIFTSGLTLYPFPLSLRYPNFLNFLTTFSIKDLKLELIFTSK